MILRRLGGRSASARPLTALLAAAALAYAPATAAAANFLVDTVLDLADDAPGDGACATTILVIPDPPVFGTVCSLRAAIEEANALPGPDAISVPAGDYVLSQGRLGVTDPVLVEGAGPGLTVVRWSDAISPALRDSVFRTEFGSGTVALRQLSIRGGWASRGGGIYSRADSLLLTDCEISGNEADGADGSVPRGGGIYVENGFLVANRCAITDNRVWDSPTWPGESYGGGLALEHLALLTNTTVARNESGARGGGIANYGVLVGYNLTLSGNEAPRGAGFWQGTTAPNPVASLSHVTITDNTALQGGGVALESGTVLRLSSSILAGNAAGMAPDCTGAGLAARGHNVLGLLGGASSCAPALAPGGGDRLVADPKLGPLADNGGATPTHLPLGGSPAIDAGGPSCTWDPGDPPPGEIVFPQPLEQDQRGLPRPVDGSGDGEARCDAGAVELVPEPGAAAAAFAALLSLSCLRRRRTGKQSPMRCARLAAARLIRR